MRVQLLCLNMCFLHGLFSILLLDPGKARAALGLWTMMRPRKAAEPEKEGACGSGSLRGGAVPGRPRHLPGLSEGKET